MKIPKQIKIGGHKVKIVYKKLEGSDGLWDSTKNQITINSELPPSQKEVTLIHELLHAINANWSETQYGHAMLESISQQLYQVLSDNKMLK